MSAWWSHALAAVVGTLFGWGCSYAKNKITKTIDPNPSTPK